MRTAHILVSDQDRNARTQASRELRLAGHEVSDVGDLDSTLSELNSASFDLLMLDITAERSRAIGMLRDLKLSQRLAPVRVVMTSGHHHDAATVLRSGADDFLGKPYNIEELIARVDLSLSRHPVLGHGDGLMRAGALCIDDTSHQVTVNGTPIKMSPREYQLLRFFAGNPSRVYSREQLLGFVWRQAQNLGPRTVDVHIRRLRSLLEPHRCAHYVETVRGAGYRFDADIVTKPSH